MKFAEGPTAHASILIDADLDSVWSLVADITTPTRFSPELQSVEWLDDATAPSLGARFIGRNQHPAIGEWQTTSTITAFEPSSIIEWRVGESDETAVSTWRFTTRRTDDGQVEVTQWCRLGPGPSGLTAAIESMPDKEERIIEVRLAEHTNNMQRNLDGLKQLAESDGGAGT